MFCWPRHIRPSRGAASKHCRCCYLHLIPEKENLHHAMSKRSFPYADDASPQPQGKVAAWRQSGQLRELPTYSPVWALKTTSCLSLGLNPIEPNHYSVICNNCVLFWQKKLKFDLSKHSKAQRSRRAICDRPFDCNKNAKEGKRHARD